MTRRSIEKLQELRDLACAVGPEPIMGLDVPSYQISPKLAIRELPIIKPVAKRTVQPANPAVYAQEALRLKTSIDI